MVALVFRAAELAYLEWLSEHSDGYVINTYGEPSNDYLVLHAASCRTISKSKRGAHPECFTGNGYIKICADDVEELGDWIAEQGFDGFTKRCDACRPTGIPTYRRLNWTRDELILALDLYHRSPAARGNKNHIGVVELSELLQELPIHPVSRRPPNFRNANGVGMKLGNFLVYDPSYNGAGLNQGAQLEQDVWNEFSGDLARLAQLASTIREHYPTLKSIGVLHLDDDVGAEEGGILQALHKYNERDKAVIQKKKKDVFEKYMALKCEVCDFDFANVYGELGYQFAECHHTKPVAKMKPGEKK